MYVSICTKYTVATICWLYGGWRLRGETINPCEAFIAYNEHDDSITVTLNTPPAPPMANRRTPLLGHPPNRVSKLQ